MIIQLLLDDFAQIDWELNTPNIFYFSIAAAEVKLMTFWQAVSCEDSIDGHSKVQIGKEDGRNRGTEQTRFMSEACSAILPNFGG